MFVQNEERATLWDTWMQSSKQTKEKCNTTFRDMLQCNWKNATPFCL